MMSPAQWDRIQEIFEQGLRQTPEQHAALIRAHGLDRDSARQLEELWAHADPPSSFLQAPYVRDATASTAAARLLRLGDTLAGRFAVLEFVGAGGMGEVYRARDERLQRIVALKVLPERLAEDANHRQRLELEARAVSSLNHPRICTLHDFGSDGDCRYLVMEYVEGETLESKLGGGPLPEIEAIDIALQVVEGLCHAHDAELIHRDLKPGNIMIGANGVKLLDFGIATRPALPPDGPGGQSVSTDLTGASQIAGTPAYMSPEQAAGRRLDARSDIFALGMVLREMVTGRRAPHAPPLSAELQRIVDRCLQPNPDERYASAAELERALQEAQRSIRIIKPDRRGALRRALAGAGAFTLLAIAAVWLSRAGFSEPGGPRLTSLTAYPGVEYSPTLSPDGKNVAFLWDGEDNDNIDVYVQAIGSDKPRRLTTDPAEEKFPQWSPDGRWIAFAREKNLVLISPSGGPEKLVAQAATRFEAQCTETFAWAPDSRQLIFNRSGPADGPAPLYAVSVEDGTVRAISHPAAGSGGDWCPVVSLDGRRIFYTHRASTTRRIHRIAWLSGNLSVTGERDAPWITGTFFAWAANGRELIHAMNASTGFFLYRTSVDQESAPRQLPYGEEGTYPAVARTGERLVYMRRKPDIDILSFRIGGEGSRGEPSKLLLSSRVDTAAEFSPDGSRIAFVSQRGGKSELWVARADGKEPIRLAPVNRITEIPRWSPDGSQIVTMSEGAVKVVDSKTGRAGTIVEASDGAQTPSYSRDGRWIYYSAARDGAWRIWRRPAAGGQAQRIAAAGGYAPIESFDGRELYFVRGGEGRADLFVMPSNGGTERMIAPVRLGTPGLCSTDRGLYFFPGFRPDDRSTVALFDPSTGKTSTIAELPIKQRYTAHGLSVAPDHGRLLYSAFDLQGDLMLVENFR